VIVDHPLTPKDIEVEIEMEVEVEMISSAIDLSNPPCLSYPAIRALIVSQRQTEMKRLLGLSVSWSINWSAEG
jgi:hypothetical protein